MPVKRRVSKVRDHRITPEAAEAFAAGDYKRLHRALGLKPWEASPLPIDVTALGVDQGEPPPWETLHAASWRQAQALQRELLKIVGPERRPLREATDDE